MKTLCPQMKGWTEADKAQRTHSGERPEQTRSCFNGVWENTLAATKGEIQIPESGLVCSGDMRRDLDP